MSELTIQPRVVSGAIDCFGNEISAYDIVKIVSLPSYLYNDIHNGHHIYRDYIGCIALVRYQDMYDLENVIWFDGRNILAEVIVNVKDEYFRPDVSIPTSYVSKIQPTAELYSIFIDYGKIRIRKNKDEERLFINYEFIRLTIASAVEIGKV